MVKLHAGDWVHSEDYGQLCDVVEAQMLYGKTTYRVWLPGSASVVRIPGLSRDGAAAHGEGGRWWL